MTSAEIEQIIYQTTLFNGLLPEQITEISSSVESVDFDAGEEIATAGAVTDHALVVVEGQLAFDEESQLAPPRLEADDHSGFMISEMALFASDFSHHQTIRAATPVKALRMYRSDMLAHLQDNRALTEMLIAKIGVRLRSIFESIREIQAVLDEEQTPPNRVPTPSITTRVANAAMQKQVA
ncbi:MAG: cyclic nucleotide-binding domain-containing protein [Hyphomicrobiaceae bacterium]